MKLLRLIRMAWSRAPLPVAVLAAFRERLGDRETRRHLAALASAEASR